MGRHVPSFNMHSLASICMYKVQYARAGPRVSNLPFHFPLRHIPLSLTALAHLNHLVRVSSSLYRL